LLKNPDSRLFKKVQMRGAREIDERGVFTDTLERGDQRNEAGEPFSTACLIKA
jgi:hypothetical protein